VDDEGGGYQNLNVADPIQKRQGIGATDAVRDEFRRGYDY
jgi:hypothetical protein